MRWLTTGSVDDPRSRRTDPAERFWPKVAKNGPIPLFAPQLGACWLWTASCDKAGYGMFRLVDRPVRAHTVAYQLEVGPVP
jgi:hypothetical protein